MKNKEVKAEEVKAEEVKAEEVKDVKAEEVKEVKEVKEDNDSQPTLKANLLELLAVEKLKVLEKIQEVTANGGALHKLKHNLIEINESIKELNSEIN